MCEPESAMARQGADSVDAPAPEEEVLNAATGEERSVDLAEGTEDVVPYEEQDYCPWGRDSLDDEVFLSPAFRQWTLPIVSKGLNSHVCSRSLMHSTVWFQVMELGYQISVSLFYPYKVLFCLELYVGSVVSEALCSLKSKSNSWIILGSIIQLGWNSCTRNMENHLVGGCLL